MHGIFIDDAQTVWLAGNGGGDHVVLHYTMEGEYLGQFGLRGLAVLDRGRRLGRPIRARHRLAAVTGQDDQGQAGQRNLEQASTHDDP